MPEFECREAAVYVHLAWDEFNRLDFWDRAKVVAHHRLHNAIESHAMAAGMGR